MWGKEWRPDNDPQSVRSQKLLAVVTGYTVAYAAYVLLTFCCPIFFFVILLLLASTGFPALLVGVVVAQIQGIRNGNPAFNAAPLVLAVFILGSIAVGIAYAISSPFRAAG